MIKSNLYLWLIILSHLLWGIVALFANHILYGDSPEYLALAENLRHGLYYAADPAAGINPLYISLRTPIYSIFILGIQSLFGSSLWPIILVQNIISIWICVFTLKIFEGFLFPKTKWIYALLIIFYPAQMIFTDTIASDLFLQLFMTLYLFHFLRFIKDKRPFYLLLTTIWLAIAFLTKPIVFPLCILHIFLLGYWLIKFRILKWIPLLFFPGLVVLGWGNFVKAKTGFFHISGVQPQNLLDYNVQSFDDFRYGYKAALAFNQEAHQRIDTIRDFETYYKTENKIAKDRIKEDLPGYILFHLYKSVRYFVEPGKWEIDLFTGYHIDGPQPKSLEKRTNFSLQYRRYGWNGVYRYLIHYPLMPLIFLIIIFNFFRIIGLIRFLLHKTIPKTLRFALIVYIGYFAIMTGPVSNATRLFLPVLLIMSAAAAIGWSGKKSISNPLK